MKCFRNTLVIIINIALAISSTSCKQTTAVSTETITQTATTEPAGTIWSPSGIIAFARTEGYNKANIYVIHTDGTGLTKIADGPGTWLEHPTWSPDGNKITYHSGFLEMNTYSVWAMNADGSNQVQLTHLPLSGLWPAWSLDGTQIAFSEYIPNTNTLKIQLIHTDGTNMTALTNGVSNDVNPSWAPNGTILFLRRQGGITGMAGDVFAVKPDGTGLVQLTTVGYVGAYALSPDGTKIALQDTINHQVIVIPTNVSGASVILVDSMTFVNSFIGCVFLALSWSPDGKALAMACSDFESIMGSDLYIVNTDGSNLTKVPNTGSVFDPSWGPK